MQVRKIINSARRMKAYRFLHLYQYIFQERRRFTMREKEKTLSVSSPEQENRQATKIFMIIATILILFSICTRPFFRIVRVTGESMYPTYQNGELQMAVRPKINELKTGMVVVFDGPDAETKGRELVKRVEGLPGDVLVVKKGILYRNGKEVKEGLDKIEDAGILAEEYTVPEDTVFCMGDNRNNSYDSRKFGAVEESKIRYQLTGERKTED